MKRKIIYISVVVFVTFFLFLTWYKWTYSMDLVENREINSNQLSSKILIATQGSEYKNQVVDVLVNHFQQDSSYIKIIDVSSLSTVQVDNWEAIVIIHTWEIWKPEENAAKFIEESYDPNKMFVVSTSGSGDNRIANIDGISGASSLDKVEENAQEIIEWLHKKVTADCHINN